MPETKIKPSHHESHAHPSAVHAKCQVCEMKATGIHYGVITCQACKIFYHRNYGTGRMPTCAKNDACDITGSARSICRACRIRKCQSVGMSRASSVRHGVRAKRPSPLTADMENALNYFLLEDIMSTHERHLASIHYVSSTVIATVQRQYQKQQVLDRELIRCVPQSCQETVTTNRGGIQADLTHLLCQVQSDFTEKDFEKKILRFISYLKAIPVLRKISTYDKTQLLKYGHFDFFLLEDYPGFNEALNVYCTSSLSCRPIQELNDLWGTDFVSEVVRFTQRLNHLNMTLKEIVFVELICILATDRCPLSVPGIVNAVQWQMKGLSIHRQRSWDHDGKWSWGFKYKPVKRLTRSWQISIHVIPMILI
ncbi:ecdysone-inducible protein E75-like [Haliotis asinina]|uniref:ecdysone-inducible protein E75-like n=1 Tax=Haliotis asinina TaxID=109174 RepID=UPI003531BD56